MHKHCHECYEIIHHFFAEVCPRPRCSRGRRTLQRSTKFKCNRSAESHFNCHNLQSVGGLAPQRRPSLVERYAPLHLLHVGIPRRTRTPQGKFHPIGSAKVYRLRFRKALRPARSFCSKNLIRDARSAPRRFHDAATTTRS